MKSEATNVSVRINCNQCKHFFVTWDPAFPRGCRSYGLKTSGIPSADVQRASGKPCMAFEPKIAKQAP
ncbi:uracil-DNA glycosylase [Paenibacillus cremeus]|uniref:Uracil-DNA glycosylase n=1 Tax=Paenibacillus cremeus TaxID=2163881 RepID=A0A559KBM3_9BACL|nr:uracil-DNA glycosylase [Paenibacillus cremeus]